jgi:small conductance mechanosensitive channel
MFTSEIWQPVMSRILLYAPQLATSLVVFFAFWLGGVVAVKVIHRLAKARDIDPDLTYFLGRAAKVGLVTFGAITALGTLGIDVTALVAGLGLTGFALGFALKDTISNALAGILIIIYKPFKQGDQIKVSAFEGTVAEVNLRYTTLSADGKKIFVPNSMVFTNAVIVGATD